MICIALYIMQIIFGESGTMATEAALLGTPSIRVSTIAKMGNFEELSDKYGLLYFDSEMDRWEKTKALLNTKNLDVKWVKKEKLMLEKINIEKLYLWIIQNYQK